MMQKLLNLCKRLAEGISALMLMALFATFLLQVFSRYALNEPLAWTLELCLVLWIWLIFFSCAFTLKHQEHVRFDVVYNMVTEKTRRVFTLIGAALISVLVALSVYPTWDYVDFMAIKKSASLNISMKTVFIIYVVFLVAIAVRYLFKVYQTMRGFNRPEQEDTSL